jgi:hypothetical protein
MGKSNEPIWFNENKVTTLNADTYQTIKTNKVDSGTEVVEINLGRSPHKIMVCTPCHSDVSMHYTQAVLKFQMECWQKKIMVSFTLLKSSLVTQGRNLCVAEMLNGPENYKGLAEKFAYGIEAAAQTLHDQSIINHLDSQSGYAKIYYGWPKQASSWTKFLEGAIQHGKA